ncbi:hypothetical protein EVAR_12657_1 [Eumeta japonica]|uniref:Uncharacterized protein n=1 Tax=Eumeta variegata TaxID=151549 RepID=A0A4C2A780_EUMVA|nr:hypothetical protein EVAR_12657_1 [Eumeta japonica]
MDETRTAETNANSGSTQEFSPFRQRYVDYEPGTSAARSYRPQTSFSGRYRQGQGYLTEYGPETTSSGQYRYGYSTHSN